MGLRMVEYGNEDEEWKRGWREVEWERGGMGLRMDGGMGTRMPLTLYCISILQTLVSQQMPEESTHQTFQRPVQQLITEERDNLSIIDMQLAHPSPSPPAWLYIRSLGYPAFRKHITALPVLITDTIPIQPLKQTLISSRLTKSGAFFVHSSHHCMTSPTHFSNNMWAWITLII